MVAADGEPGRGIRYANSFYVIYGRSVMSAQMLEVFPLGVGMNGAPSRKGCVVNDQMVK